MLCDRVFGFPVVLVLADRVVYVLSEIGLKFDGCNRDSINEENKVD